MNETTTAKIDWVSGRWEKNRKKYMATVLGPAVACAEEYLNEVLGVEPTTTRVIPYLTIRSNLARGVSVSATAMELYFSRIEIDRKKLESKECEITSTCVHEMAHGVREKYFPNTSVLIERIASEGIAYTAQAYAEQDIFDIPYEKTVLLDTLEVEALADELYQDPACFEVIPELTHEEVWANPWLYAAKKVPFAWGQRLGIWCVQSLVKDGYDFPALMMMPPEEIIAL
ncbi:hypothetical protein H0V99_00430 [Candidatus Saccharibacteria bacterium]|nr:hypothetical protein [Candidatus Saccharibacteria bacterium]